MHILRACVYILPYLTPVFSQNFLPINADKERVAIPYIKIWVLSLNLHREPNQDKAFV